MRIDRIGRLPMVAGFALFFSGIASAQYAPPELVSPAYPHVATPGVPSVLPIADPPTAGSAKSGDLTKLYDPTLISDRPIRYFGKPRKKGCFQKETLFEWSVGCDLRKNGNGNGDEAEEPEEDRLSSDRPDFTEASSTVGRGRVQLEAGYTFIGDNGGGVRTRTHSYPEALLRIGMFADWFELRIAENVFTQTVTAGGTRMRDSGSADLYLGAKLALTKQKGVMPESAIILQGTVPTGARAFTANRTLYGFNYLFSWELTDTVSFGGSFQGNKAVDDTGRSYVLFAQSLTVGYTITKNLNGYTEWFALHPTFANATGGGAQHYIDGGFQYFVTNNFALDIRLGVGLSRSADDLFAGTGFVVRY